MRFKEFISENEEAEIEQHDSARDLSQINFRLADALDNTFLSPESGVLAIRKVLEDFDLDLPALYGVTSEGEEMVFELDSKKLYILYGPTDDGRYEFYAETGDDKRMDELLSDEEEDEEEQE